MCQPKAPSYILQLLHTVVGKNEIRKQVRIIYSITESSVVKESKSELCCLLFEITSFLASSPEGTNLFFSGAEFDIQKRNKVSQMVILIFQKRSTSFIFFSNKRKFRENLVLTRSAWQPPPFQCPGENSLLWFFLFLFWFNINSE